jgi:hypothetical protein
LNVFHNECFLHVFHNECFLQAKMPVLLQIPKLLLPLLIDCPAFIPAAREANLTAGLIDVLRAFLPGGYPLGEKPLEGALVIYPVSCLSRLIGHPKEDDYSTEFMGPAMDAGIVSVLTDLVMQRDEETTGVLLGLVLLVLLAVPQGGAGGLPRAVAGLLSFDCPKTLGVTTEMLSCIASMRPDLILDCHTWGIKDSLERLTLNNDEGTAAAARKLLFLVNLMADVSLPLSEACEQNHRACVIIEQALAPAQQGLVHSGLLHSSSLEHPTCYGDPHMVRA